MAFLALAADFSPPAHDLLLLLKSERTPSHLPTSAAISVFLRTKRNWDGSGPIYIFGRRDYLIDSD
jgi:hypothetical protein